MEVLTGVLALVVLVGLIVVSYGATFGAMLFGRRLPWLWFALAVFELVTKIGSVALYREVDNVRGLASLGAAILAAVLAILAHRRFESVVLVLGGFLGTALTVIQVLGPLLNPAPQWFIFALLVASGIAGAIWARSNRSTATIVLSALVGSGILTDSLVETIGIDEAHRFQVHVILALGGVGFQMWMRRRAERAALVHAESASAPTRS